MRRLGFPAFSDGTICSHGYSHIVDLHTPVRVGGLEVHPGDLLHADTNGVVAIPLAIAGEIADAAAEFVKAEAGLLEYLTGDVAPTTFQQARASMMSDLAALGKRVRAKSAKA